MGTVKTTIITLVMASVLGICTTAQADDLEFCTKKCILFSDNADALKSCMRECAKNSVNNNTNQASNEAVDKLLNKSKEYEQMAKNVQNDIHDIKTKLDNTNQQTIQNNTKAKIKQHLHDLINDL